jgi:hypothetical protein
LYFACTKEVRIFGTSKSFNPNKRSKIEIIIVSVQTVNNIPKLIGNPLVVVLGVPVNGGNLARAL